jgi:hypothetical protein
VIDFEGDPGPLVEELERVLVILAILHDHCSPATFDDALVIRQAVGRNIGVRAFIHEVDHDAGDLPGLPKGPSHINGMVVVCSNFREFVKWLDASKIWIRSNDDLARVAAVKVALFQRRLAEGGSPRWDEPIRFRLGREFAKSCQRIPSDETTAAKVLRAMVETAERANMSATHWLRTGKGASDPQQTRSGDKAWRRNIDDGRRLHYWECADGIAEFASVGPHNDFTIPN